MKQLTPFGVLLGLVLLSLAVASTFFIFNLRSQRAETTQPPIEIVP